MRYLSKVRENCPLIHNITNYVTVNDVANVLLATGAAPLMADAIEEMDDIVSISWGLNLNIGTLNSRIVGSMMAAAEKSHQLGHITVLDPVGAGASQYRTHTAKMLVKTGYMDGIKGNISEIKALYQGSETTSGVDANIDDLVTEDNLDAAVSFISRVAAKQKSVIIATGALDIVSDGKKTIVIRNGRPEMKSITGTGCMTSALIAAFMSVNRETPVEAAAAAVMMMGIAGEEGWSRLKEGDGNLAYRTAIIDSIYNMTDEKMEKEGRYEIR